MQKHHKKGKHEYLVSKRIFEADFMINLPKLQEFDFDYLKVGRKIYNHDVPCTITRVLDDGEFMCETEDGSDVPWASKIESIKNGEMTRNEDEWKNQDRVHILSEHIWWFRK